MPWHEMLARNERWAAAHKARDPEFFQRIASYHRPKAIYIGCSDARVPSNLVTDTDVGDLFVHRNIANQYQTTDASLAASLQYAIEVLGVNDVIVCGHHSCGGVRAALGATAPGDVEKWIGALRMLARVHKAELEGKTEDEQVDLLVDINVAEQVTALSRHPSVRAAWANGRNLRLHGWVYDLPSGLLQHRVMFEGPEALNAPPPVASAGLGVQAK